jgi:hypothetical protein
MSQGKIHISGPWVLPPDTAGLDPKVRENQHVSTWLQA